MTLQLRDVALEQQEYEERFKLAEAVIPVVLCNVLGETEDSGGLAMSASVESDPLFVWCRAYNDAPPFPVLNMGVVPPYTGMPVFVGYREGSVQMEVLGVNQGAMESNFQIGDLLTAHAAQHYLDGFDPLHVEARMLTMLKTTRVPSALKVSVTPVEYDDAAGSRVFYPGKAKMALPSVTASKKKWVLVYLDVADNTVKFLSGTEVADSPPIVASKPDVPVGGIPSANVMLRDSDTEIAEADIDDARRFVHLMGSTTIIADASEILKHRVFN